MSVQVLPGPGIVARFGDVVLWLEEREGGAPAVAARLLGLARELSEGGVGHGAGSQVAEVLRAEPGAIGALVLLVPTAAGLQAVVHGWGRVLGDGIDIDGGWTDRELPWTTALAVGRGGHILRAPTPGSVLDLRRGSTPGGGAAVALAARELVPTTATASVASAPAAGAEADREAEERSSFERVDLRAAPPRREPLPVGGSGGAVSAATGVTVKGVVCSRGHFNNPIALFCGTCGISMDQITRILQDGTRPSLGTLVIDDGTAFGLDTDHLVGSAPSSDPSAVAGEVRPVTLDDPSGQLASAHAEIRLVGWDVVLVARAPTYVLAPGGRQWVPAPPGQAHPLSAGARVATGQRTFVVESNARNSGV